jgi:hypothetical protein
MFRSFFLKDLLLTAALRTAFPRRLSMSNVPQNSNAVMIAPMISVYIFSLFAYWILHRYGARVR